MALPLVPEIAVLSATSPPIHFLSDSGVDENRRSVALT